MAAGTGPPGGLMPLKGRGAKGSQRPLLPAPCGSVTLPASAALIHPPGGLMPLKGRGSKDAGRPLPPRGFNAPEGQW
jgi:hypothetical protein